MEAVSAIMLVEVVLMFLVKVGSIYIVIAA
jgi:hypothetical protein